MLALLAQKCWEWSPVCRGTDKQVLAISFSRAAGVMEALLSPFPLPPPPPPLLRPHTTPILVSSFTLWKDTCRHMPLHANATTNFMRSTGSLLLPAFTSRSRYSLQRQSKQLWEV